MKRIGSLVLTLVFGSCAVPQPMAPVREASAARAEVRERMRSSHPPAILFVGNSYSFGLPRALEREAARHGRSIRTGQASRDTWRLAQHAADSGTLGAIRSGKWDIVVLQEQSLIPAMPRNQRHSRMDPALRALVTAARDAGAIPVLYQTWGRRDGDPRLRNDDFRAMNRRVRQGYHEASRLAGGLFIVPVGNVWEREVEAGRGAALFLPDGSHPSEAGFRLAARVFFEAFFDS